MEQFSASGQRDRLCSSGYLIEAWIASSDWGGDAVMMCDVALEATFLKDFVPKCLFPASHKVCHPRCLSACHSGQFLADGSSLFGQRLAKEGDSVRALSTTKGSYQQKIVGKWL